MKYAMQEPAELSRVFIHLVALLWTKSKKPYAETKKPVTNTS